MAKQRVYGGRWENVGHDIGAGGQSVVRRVRDLTDPNGPEYALKRLKNPERRERFMDEIESLRSINHPNVMKIVDYARATESEGEPYWFVMPLAQDNLEERKGLYKDNLDAVLRVAQQLAAASPQRMPLASSHIVTSSRRMSFSLGSTTTFGSAILESAISRWIAEGSQRSARPWREAGLVRNIVLVSFRNRDWSKSCAFRIFVLRSSGSYALRHSC
ncbi:MAG TPA: hypothetical protein PKE16_08765 [Hyphomicrobium sp.]|nr:hypothetical protein [Hyphomicrobium sp.]